MPCSARRHRWDADPPVPGKTKCTKCGKAFGDPAPGKVPGRPRKATAPVPTPAPAAPPPTETPALPSRLLAKWQPAAPASPPAEAPAPAPATEKSGPNPTTEKFVDFFAVPVADGSIVGCGKLHRYLGRQPNEPDPEWMEKYRAAVRDVMIQYLPDAEMTPLSRLIGCLVVLNMGMWIGARELEQPKAKEAQEKPVPPLKLVKSRPQQEPESWPEKATTRAETVHADTPDGAPSSAESDLSSLTHPSDPTIGLQPTAGDAPGADPSV